MSVLVNSVEHDGQAERAEQIHKARHKPARVAAAREEVANSHVYPGPRVVSIKPSKKAVYGSLAAAGLGATATVGAAGAGGVALARRRREKADVSKGAFGIGRKAAPAAKKFSAADLKFTKPKPGVKPTGPGSQRASMSPSAWESQTAAARRKA